LQVNWIIEKQVKRKTTGEGEGEGKGKGKWEKINCKPCIWLWN